MYNFRRGIPHEFVLVLRRTFLGAVLPILAATGRFQIINILV
jgi:hypothetical protein